MRTTNKLIAYLLAALSAQPFLHANTLIVDNTGGTPSSYLTIQDAISASISGDTILLTAGQTFTGNGNNNLLIASTDLTFGKTGNATDPIVDMQNIASYRFLRIDSLSTVSMSNLVIVNGNRNDSDGGAIHNSGTLHAFMCTFTNNHVTASGVGGAIYNAHNATFSACIFIANSSESNAGGAIENGDTLIITNTCVFNNNSASKGGAIHNAGSLICTGCTLSNNGADQSGGALYNYLGTATIANCTFNSNTANPINFFGGGALANENGSTYVLDSTCDGNNAFWGGAVYNIGDSASSIVITRCTFNNNSASGTQAEGGAINNDSSFGIVTVQSSIFTYNNAIGIGTNGGAIAHPGAIKKVDSRAPSTQVIYATDCSFIGNTATNLGGAIKNEADCDFYITNCTFSGNNAPLGGAAANQAQGRTANLIGTGCIFIGNSATNGGALYNIGNLAYSTINCSRFIDNSATVSGSAIFNDVLSPTVNAENNWWGNNTNPALRTNLLYGDIDADPWITMALIVEPMSIGSFNIIAQFTPDCIPDGTPVAFTTTEGSITPTFGTTSNGSVSVILTSVTDTATVCAIAEPTSNEPFSICTPVQILDYAFLEGSRIDISTGTDVIYALDWCQQNPGTTQPPLLAAGGAIDSQVCNNPNIFVYTLDDICQTNENGPLNPRIFTLTNGSFDSNIVNAIQWCCNNNAPCPQFPYLAVGGKTSATNTHIYFIDPTTYTLKSAAHAPDNSLGSINAVSWNPSCNCTMLTVGGCQQNGSPACNIIAYKKTIGKQILTDTEHILFDTNVTSLDWCKTNTLPANLCAYLAVGTTGTTPCKGGFDETNQIVVYKASFCKNGNNVTPCR